MIKSSEILKKTTIDSTVLNNRFVRTIKRGKQKRWGNDTIYREVTGHI